MAYNETIGRTLSDAALEAGTTYCAVHKAFTLVLQELMGTPAYATVYAIACTEEKRLSDAWTAATNAATAYFSQCTNDFNARYEGQLRTTGHLQAAA
jgi:hypothetical protein